MESKHWTQDEVNYLIKYHKEKKSSEIADALNRPIESVKSKISRLGLRKEQAIQSNIFNKKPQIGKADSRIRGKFTNKKSFENKAESVMVPVRIDYKTIIYIKSGDNPEEARIKYIERTTKPQIY
jgi:hypothetical protein